MTEPTRYELSAGVATLTLDAPGERRNAFSQDLLAGMMAAVRAAAADDAVRGCWSSRTAARPSPPAPT